MSWNSILYSNVCRVSWCFVTLLRGVHLDSDIPWTDLLVHYSVIFVIIVILWLKNDTWSLSQKFSFTWVGISGIRFWWNPCTCHYLHPMKKKKITFGYGFVTRIGPLPSWLLRVFFFFFNLNRFTKRVFPLSIFFNTVQIHVHEIHGIFVIKLLVTQLQTFGPLMSHGHFPTQPIPGDRNHSPSCETECQVGWTVSTGRPVESGGWGCDGF